MATEQEGDTSGLTLDDCKAYLQSPSGLENGGTVFDHLAEILPKLCEERPANPVDVFEEVSSAVKQTHFNAREAPLRSAYIEHPSQEWARQITDQLKVRGPGEAGACVIENCCIQNIVRDAVLIEQAGIGIKPYEATRIAVGLQRLANDFPVSTVRFWGRINGTECDYIVAECQFKAGHSGSQPAVCEKKQLIQQAEGGPIERMVPPEKDSTGLNTFTYFVTGASTTVSCQTGGVELAKWVQLPATRPECIMSARQISKMVTGRLNAPVLAYPPFPGTEADYLRAIIARIAHGATMAVDGMFEIGEDEETGAQTIKLKDEANALKGGEPPYEIVPAGEEGLTPAEGWAEKWVHHPLYPPIFQEIGRTSWPKRWGDNSLTPAGADGDDVKEGEEVAEGEIMPEPIPVNTNLAEERKIGDAETGMASWTVRMMVPLLADRSPVVLRSLRWPGAFCLVAGAECVNVYCGNGLKYSEERLQPSMPPVLPSECSEILPSEEGSDEPGANRPGMVECADELLPNPFNEVDQTNENGEEEEEQ